MHQAILSVGSNINPQENCHQAEAILTAEHRFLGRSSYIITAPVGYQDQDDFLNGAYLVETDLGYEEFNVYLKDIERRLGRVKGPIKSGPRTMDLDIIVWDGVVVHEDYGTKDYTTDPVDEILASFGVTLQTQHPAAQRRIEARSPASRLTA
jgi:2-amino-4-hydroxy-6-hydroxymethyldihydropteridine diphosphokinase